MNVAVNAAINSTKGDPNHTSPSLATRKETAGMESRETLQFICESKSNLDAYSFYENIGRKLLVFGEESNETEIMQTMRLYNRR